MVQEPAAPSAPKSLIASIVISAGLVAPFMVLQWVNRRTLQEDFPVALFVFMSLHSLLIVGLLTPALQRLRAQRSLRALHLGHWAGLVFGAILVLGYVEVIRDQLPCFLGVPNCD